MNVASSSLVSRSIFILLVNINIFFAHIAQAVERVLGKDEVTSSSLVVGSIRFI